MARCVAIFSRDLAARASRLPRLRPAPPRTRRAMPEEGSMLISVLGNPASQPAYCDQEKMQAESYHMSAVVPCRKWSSKALMDAPAAMEGKRNAWICLQGDGSSPEGATSHPPTYETSDFTLRGRSHVARAQHKDRACDSKAHAPTACNQNARTGQSRPPTSILSRKPSEDPSVRQHRAWIKRHRSRRITPPLHICV